MNRTGLTELEAVLAVARRGGFRAAARDMGMSSSALSHAVAGLEARLGVRLFNRTTRSVSLSSAGEQFVEQVGPALAAIHGAMEDVDQHRDTPSGILRLNTSLGAAQMLLRPLILAYMRRYPEMKVEVVTEGAFVDIVAGGFDAGFRLAESVPVDMTAVTVIPTIRSVVAGSPAYFENRVPPRSPSDLRNHRCIRARMASGSLYHWEFEKRGQAVTVDVPGDLTLDASELMREAALEGFGLTYLPDTTLGEDIAAGRLVQVLDDWTPSYPGLQLYYPGRKHAPAKLRAFIDMAREYAKTF